MLKQTKVETQHILQDAVTAVREVYSNKLLKKKRKISTKQPNFIPEATRKRMN